MYTVYLIWSNNIPLALEQLSVVEQFSQSLLDATDGKKLVGNEIQTTRNPLRNL